MTFYTNIILLTELLMLTMLVHVINYSGFKRKQKIWYVLTFSAIMLCAAAEFAVHNGHYDPSFKGLLTVATAIQFSIAPFLGTLFIGALGLDKHAMIMSAVLAIHAVFELVAAPYGLVFSFGENGYSRGSLFLVYEAFYVLSLVFLIICMVIVGRRFKHRDVMTIVMILVVLVAGIIPMTFFQINITYLAVAISACLCYIYYNDLVQQDIQAELVLNQRKMTKMQEHMIFGLANLIENRDMETGEHIVRTREYVKLIAENTRKEGYYTDVLDDKFISCLETLAPMHDIGNILIPDSILKKPGRLTPEEFEEMKKHASLGGDVIKGVLNGVTDEEYLQFASDIAMYHHERWDGTGYPKGLKGEEIPLSARIMALADVFDALISERCYKAPIPKEEAFKIIEQESGTHFDPVLTRIFLEQKDEF
ncbi:MAG: HD domain-containing protein [Clostridia bacterium]|nr:HD domain-containing protein [Clostridia bacterium]